MNAIDALSNKLSSYLEPAQIKKVLRAYHYADKRHHGQMRQSGDPYITHPIAVANILADMHLDHESLMAALLHDVIEDTGASKTQLQLRFGKNVAQLVDGVSKLTEIEFASKAEQQAENFQKMILAMAKDVRVMLVKLADRLHNMRTLSVLNPAKRRRIARETLEIYAPIAQRLGINDLRLEFEELGFAALYPMRHQRLKAALKAARGHRKELVSEINNALSLRLKQEGLDAEVQGREKHLWSIYQKMRTKHRAFREIMDVFAFRIITTSVDDCYRTLGAIHNLYKPVPGSFTDYIAIPKLNGYQSLHTVLVGMHGIPIEVQIRTKEMDNMANYGIAAHWLYKSKQENESPRVNRWVKGLLEMQQQAGNSLEFIEHVKTDLMTDGVYAFTPRGEIISLPYGATPVDFAYAVHTAVGDNCIACRINGELSSLSQPLNNGDKVKIITSRSAQPNPAWINFVVTAKARSAIRHFLKTRHHDESVELGKRLLDSALENFGYSYSSIRKSWIKRLLKRTNAPSFETVLEQVGLGNRLPFAVANMLVPASKQLDEIPTDSHQPIMIDTSSGLVINYARCCHPITGEHIIGHLSPGKGIVVHRDSCKNLKEIRHDPNKCTPVNWSEHISGEFSAEFKVELNAGKGLLATLANKIADTGGTIEKVTVDDRNAVTAVVTILMAVNDRAHLAEVMRKIRSTKEVQRVYRVKN